MGIGILVAGLAFFIALIALWLTSDVLKKVETQNKRFVQSHLVVMRDELKAMDKKLREITRTAKTGKDMETGFDGRLNDHTKELDILKGHSLQLSQKLESLDTSIPARYRVRVAVKDDKPKDKPSIQ